jgi:hypothetical protein
MHVLRRHPAAAATSPACLLADANSADEEVHHLSIIITAMLGFASYKVAVVAAALAPSAIGVAKEAPAKRP